MLVICALHFTHPSAHTPWTHTRSSGQPFMPRRPGSSRGSVPCSRAPRRGIVGGERALYIHSLHLQFLPARDSNSQPFGYESDSLPLGQDFPYLHIGRHTTCAVLGVLHGEVWEPLDKGICQMHKCMIGLKSCSHVTLLTHLIPWSYLSESLLIRTGWLSLWHCHFPLV